MFKELIGNAVTVFLNCSQWNEYRVAGVVSKVDNNWLYLTAKKKTEIIALTEIKRISVKTP